MANNKRLTALTVRHLNVTDNIRIRGTLYANASLQSATELVYPSGSTGISMEGSSIIKINASDIEVSPPISSTTPRLHGAFDISCNDISCNVIHAVTFNINDINCNDISGSTAYFTDISGVSAKFNDISGSRAYFTDISGSTAYFTDLSCNVLSASEDIVSNTSSDIRFKTNVNKIENPLEKISKINGYTYDWIQSNLHPYNGKDTGIIAQEVETMDLPGIVVTRSNGYKGVKYERLIPLLLESIKSLQETDVKQQEQINRLMEK